MPTKQIVSDLFGNIASEDALQETSKRVKPTEVNGKSEFHLGWRMCRDYLKNIPVLTISSEEAREYEQLKGVKERMKNEFDWTKHDGEIINVPDELDPKKFFGKSKNQSIEEERSKGGWISVKERLPKEEDCFDNYHEVLTVQVGRKRPTMMKYWELEHCPFTTYWTGISILPSLPIPIQ